jgi:hypothetical protein
MPPCGARRRCRLRSSGPSCGSERIRDSVCGVGRRRDDGFEPSTMQPVVQRGASVGHDGSNPSSLRFGAEREWGGASSDFAEREGFEPSVRLPVHMISNHAPSATRSPLRGAPVRLTGRAASASLQRASSPGGGGAGVAPKRHHPLRREWDSNPRYPCGYA